jgi:hypothetical protein
MHPTIVTALRHDPSFHIEGWQEYVENKNKILGVGVGRGIQRHVAKKIGTFIIL